MVKTQSGEAAREGDTPTVVTALPALGKTTGTVKTAADRPLSYLAPRKELQQQALEKAARWGVDAQVLPVFSEERVRDGVLNAAVSNVREVGKDRLRDCWAILDLAVGDAEDDLKPSDIFEDDEDGESVGLERPTCETAEGDHGVAWALAVHVARRLGYTPQEIHTQARWLFGAPLPCSCDDHHDGAACNYTEGWKAVRDADEPTDLLVGSYVYGHVESVRTHYDRDPSGDVQRTPRALVLDEFVGEAFTREFGDEALDFATWLASALREDVINRRDMHRANLWGDDWVQTWLKGDTVDHPEIQDTVGALARYAALLGAREGAREILAEVDTSVLKALGLSDALDLVDVGPRQVRRVLAELVDAGYLRCVDDSGRSKRYEPLDQPGAGEVDLPERGDAVASGGATGHSPTNQYYTWNVRIAGG